MDYLKDNTKYFENEIEFYKAKSEYFESLYRGEMTEGKTNGTIFTKDYFAQVIEQSNEHMKKLYRIIEELKEENERLREALKFYSDLENYNRLSASQITLIAREALEKE